MIRLRPRQETFRDRCADALKERGNTLGVAPTGAGKTVMLSAIAGAITPRGAHTLVLQHRDELVKQNRTTFAAMNPGISTGLFTAGRKEWGYGATFAMVQTLGKQEHLEAMPPVDLMIVDEAHHCAADTYLRTIDSARKRNPNLKLLGVTATPNRGDKKALRGIFDNCADQITIRELIDTRFLVPPKTYVIDIGVRDELSKVKRTVSDFDMDAVAEIMDHQILNEKIVEHWKEKAGDRQTVIFASTVAHASHVADTFRDSGVRCDVVTGDMGQQERARVLDSYGRGDTQVLCNVAVLTEGWDHQPTSCVILLRPSSYKSTMIQMIGRGLRKVDPERYPGVRKDDCVVLDFGTSVLMHGSLEQAVHLDQQGTKECPECNAVLPAQATDCPICGFEFPRPEAETKVCPECGTENALSARVCIECDHPFGDADEKGELSDFVLTEVDLLNQSPYLWHEMFGGWVLMATAFDGWAACVLYQGRWMAVGGAKEAGVHLLSDAEDRMISLASADDFLRLHGDMDNGNKTAKWMHQPMTEKQRQMLRIPQEQAFAVTKYDAACRITWKMQERAIRAKLESTQRRLAA